MKQEQLKPSKAGKFVSTDHVQTLRANYKEKRWLENSTKLGKPDSLSVWYSLEELEGFMSEIRENGGDGVRMYFGVYGDNNAPQQQYEGRQTIVMVATKLRESDGIGVNKDLFINKGNENSILAYNLGSLCPPFCIKQGGGFTEDFELKVTEDAVTV